MHGPVGHGLRIFNIHVAAWVANHLSIQRYRRK
jgi:hypothetical protein